MRKMSWSPMRTVSTSPPLGVRMRMRGGGAVGADVMLIMSGSLQSSNQSRIKFPLHRHRGTWIPPHGTNLPDGHHAEGHVPRRHVVSALDLVDFVTFGHDDAVVLQDDGVGEHAVHGLRVAVATVHGQIQPERVAVLHVDVARLAAPQGVDAPVERTVRLHVHLDLGVAAQHRHCKQTINRRSLPSIQATGDGLRVSPAPPLPSPLPIDGVGVLPS